MAESWMLQVLTAVAAASWDEAAARTHAFLETVSDLVAQGAYGQPLVWADEYGASVSAASPTGAVQGSLAPGDLAEGAQLVDVSWEFGAGGAGADFRATFAAASLAQPARQLHEHDKAWLSRLLCEAAAALDADMGRITTQRLDDALRARLGVVPLRLGALSLAPRGVLVDALPPSVTWFACPVGYPGGRVVAVDLARVATDPESVVGDLIGVDAALSARAAALR